MRNRHLASLLAASLLLATCTSCSIRVGDLDQDGDGIVTRSDLLTAVFNSLCGDEEPEEPAPMEPTEPDPTDPVGPRGNESL